MTRLEKKLRASLRRLGLAESDKILVAVSGGADSTALLDALVRLRGCAKTPKEIYAAHLNHLLRGAESDADDAFVRELCARLEIPFLTERVKVSACAKAGSQNLEAMARRLRYDFLQCAARQFGAKVIVTAHTRDDQVETIVMRLLRGTGTEGLRGIHQVVALTFEIKLIRPLLEITRPEIIAHCEHYGVAFRTDSSNLSTDFTRNRVRHELLPTLRTYNPRFDEALLRIGERIAEDDDYLNHAATELLTASQILPEDSSLDLKPLLLAHPALRRRMLRWWLREVRGDLRRIDAAHLIALDSLAMKSENERYVEIPGGWQIRRRRGRLLAVRITGDI